MIAGLQSYFSARLFSSACDRIQGIPSKISNDLLQRNFVMGCVHVYIPSNTAGECHLKVASLLFLLSCLCHHNGGHPGLVVFLVASLVTATPYYSNESQSGWHFNPALQCRERQLLRRSFSPTDRRIAIGAWSLSVP